MRFKRLQIPAFGPFTDLELHFPAGSRDFHVIYGENEAGKSSLLRAIRDLLFGIHGRSPDNFRHDYNGLRIVGEIVNQAGAELTFQRRKGRKDTLLDAAGNALPDPALTPFLGSVDAGYFSTMFGLGNRELHAGADALLRGEGEVGKALFSASMGGTPIQQVLGVLTGEAERLFKGRASANVTIRPAVKLHKELLKQSRESMVRAEEWTKVETELAGQNSAKQELEAGIDKLKAELDWIGRCEDALPTVGRLLEERRRFAGLPELPKVASDFVGRARGAREEARKAGEKVESLGAHITQLEDDMKNCATAPHVLAEADVLDSLHQELGAYRNRRTTLEDLQAKLLGKESLLRSGMNDLELDGAFESLEAARLTSTVLMGCQEAADTLAKAREQSDRAAVKQGELTRKIETLAGQLSEIPEKDLTPLREALAVAAEATEAHKTLNAGDAEIGKLNSEIADKLSMVAGAPDDLDQAAGLQVPSAATIRTYGKELDDVARSLKETEARVEEHEQAVAGLNAELERLQRRGELPSEDLLQQARDHRDHGWALVLADWKGDGTEEVLEADVPLADAYPQAVTKADEIVDEMRSHADAVAQAEEKRLQIRQKKGAIEKEEDRISTLKSSLAECQTRWTQEWAACGIKPKSPAEMEDWRESWIDFRETLKRLRTAEQESEARHKRVADAKQALAMVLENSNQKDFSVLFEAARKEVADGERREGQREERDGQLVAYQKELEAIEQNAKEGEQTLTAAMAGWQAQCTKVGLPVSVSCKSGIKLLEQRKKLIEDFDRWKELREQMRQTQEALSGYEERVRKMAELFQVESETIEGLEAALWRLFSEACEAKTQTDQLAGQIKSNQADLDAAKIVAVQADQTLNELMEVAGLDSLEDLEPLLANLEQREKIQGALDSAGETLSGLARGQNADEFVVRVQAENPDELPQRKSGKERERANKDVELQEIRKKLAELNVQKEQLEKAGDTAARLNQQAEAVAASIRKDAARFLRLNLATHFLETQIERFRQQNQGPLLEESGEIFRQITLGAFSGLAADYSEDDVPVIVGRRENGSRVPVAGLSDGSRDQLYLALRLAALNRHLAEREPMPLILDDLLITFDDERSKAILPQLAALAERSQVFLFTHHRHLVNLCRETLGEDQYTLHELSVNP